MGSTLLETIVVLAVLSLLLQVTVSTLDGWRSRQLLRGATHTLRLSYLRMSAAARAAGRSHGLDFEPAASGLSWRPVVDGDGDGLRRADLSSGVDLPLGPWSRLERWFPGVRPGRPPGVPALGGGAGGSDGLSLGRSNLLSCSPRGSSSSGTIYLHIVSGDGAALRFYGPTGRVTVWWWAASGAAWEPLS